MEQEIWIEYDRYPAGLPKSDGTRTWTRFEVSNLGNVRKWSGKTGLCKQIIPKLTGGGNGVQFLGLPSNRHKYIHRLVAQHFVPNPNSCTCVMHINGDRLNNHWTNLCWATKSEVRRNANR
jgi:hypothetical protein